MRKALAMGADRAVVVSDDAAAGSDLIATSSAARGRARARGRRSRPLRPGVLRCRRRRALGGGRRPPAAPADLAGRQAEGGRRRGDRQAADRVRLRRDRRAAAGGGRRLGRDQRASLPLAEGDHGREVQAGRDALARRPRTRRRGAPAKRARGPPCSRSRRPSRAAISCGSRTTAAPQRRSSPTSPRGSCCDDARLPRAPRGRAAEGRARRARESALRSGSTRPVSCSARHRRRRRHGRRHRSTPATIRRSAAPLPQPRVDALAALVEQTRRRHRALRRVGARRRRRGRPRCSPRTPA